MRDLPLSQTSQARIEFKRRVDMFNNNWADQLDNELKRQFHEKTYPKVALMADTTQNIFRRIVNEICSVYREPARRYLPGMTPEEAQVFNQDLAKMRLDQTMMVAHRYAKAATVSFLMPRLKADGNVVVRVLTPDLVYVETDPEDPAKISLFAYVSTVITPRNETRQVWTVYTESERWYATAEGKPYMVDPRTDQSYDHTNVYGVVPVVAFPAEFQVVDFYNTFWNKDAAEANLKIGLMLTYQNYLVKTQSFKQIVIKADSVSEELKGAVLDPLYPLLLKNGGEATTLDLNTQLSAIDQVIRGKVAAIANNYGISNENFTLTTQAASGFSLKIANQALQDIRLADVPLCASVEQQLYKVIAAMRGDTTDKDIAFDPGEVAWPEEWSTEEQRWNFEFKNGAANVIDYLLSRNPQLSREEAKAYLAQRQAEMKELRKSNMTPWELVVQEAMNREGASGDQGEEDGKTQTGQQAKTVAPVAELADLASKAEGEEANAPGA